MEYPHNSEKTVDLIWELMQEVRQISHPVKKGETTMQQFLLLKALARHGEQKVGELAGRVGLTQSSVSIAIKRLEKDGLVVRERDPADERRVSLALTAAGRAVLHDWQAKRNRAIAGFLHRLSPAEQSQFHALLERMLSPQNPCGEEHN